MMKVGNLLFSSTKIITYWVAKPFNKSSTGFILSFL